MNRSEAPWPVCHELHEEMTEAMVREKRLKKWNRAWEICSIQKKSGGMPCMNHCRARWIPACAGMTQYIIVEEGGNGNKWIPACTEMANSGNVAIEVSG